MKTLVQLSNYLAVMSMNDHEGIQQQEQITKRMKTKNSKTSKVATDVDSEGIEQQGTSSNVVPNVEIEFVNIAGIKQSDFVRAVMEAADDLKVLEAPSTSKQHTDGNDDEDLDGTVEDFARMVDDMSDCDMDICDETYDALTVPLRDAAVEPAFLTDLTTCEARILEAEDRRNDLAIRQLVPAVSCEFGWTRDRETFAGQRETFTGASGPTFTITDETRIVDLFYKMIDIDFVDRLCTETNRYADQKIKLLTDQNKLSPTSRLRRWKPTDRDEMVSFLALLMLQGLYPLTEEGSYFSFNGFGTMPYFARIMSYNRYILLKSMIHFVDNETITHATNLCKVQPVIDYFNTKFSSLYYPSQEIVIDESLLRSTGRLSFAQKIATKAAQVGVKTYELCDSSSGYVWKFFVNVGKNKTDGDIPEKDDTTDPPTTGSSNECTNNATAKIVYDLVEPLLHRGHTLIMDNFYNCPLFARCLKQQKTDCYGTLRLNREFVPEYIKKLTRTQLKQGEAVASYCSDLSVSVWRDTNLVCMLSTYHYLEIGTQYKHNKLTYKPTVVLDYNKSMVGVDKKDQYLSAQPMERQKNKIWYKKLFRRMFNSALFNTFIIFRTAHPNVSHRKFRTLMAEDLLKLHRRIDLTTEPRLMPTQTGPTMTMKKIPRKPKGHRRPKVKHRHFPTRTGFKASRCWWCAQQKVVARTVWKCLECDVNLCVGGCFIEYHT